MKDKLPGFDERITIENQDYIVWHTVETRMTSKWLHLAISRLEGEERKIIYVAETIPISYSNWHKVKREIITRGNQVESVKPLYELASIQPGELEKVLDAFGKSQGLE